MGACGTAVADTDTTEPISGADQFVEGWYVISLKAGQNAFIGNKICAVEAGQYPYNQYGIYGMSFTTSDVETGIIHYVHMTPSANKATAVMEPVGGLYISNEGSISVTSANVAVNFQNNGISLNNWGMFANFNATNASGVNILGKSSSFSGNRWDFTPANPTGTIYKVNITNDLGFTAASELDHNFIVRYLNEDYTGIKAVHNGGYFIIEGGTQPTEADFIAGVTGTAEITPTASDTDITITDAPEGAHYDKIINVTFKTIFSKAQFKAGWYVISLKAGQSTFIGNKICAVEAGQFPYNDYGAYGMTYTDANAETSSKHYIYITPNADKTTAGMQPAGGLYLNNGGSAATSTNNSITFNDNGISFSNWGFFHNLAMTNLTADIIGMSRNFSGNRWNLIPVNPAGTIYKVNIANDRGLTSYPQLDQNHIVHYNNADYQGIKSVHNGGYYFIEGENQPTEADFITGVMDEFITGTNEDIEHYRANDLTVEIVDAPANSGYNKAINVTFGDTKYDMEALLSEKFPDGRFYGTHKVLGYADNTTLAEALDNLVNTPTQDAYNALKTAQTTYLADNSNRGELPVDGKAYAFVNLHNNGWRYFDVNASTQIATIPCDKSISEFPVSARFVCHLVNEDEHRYIFANDCGQYLIWKGGKDNNDGADGLTANVAASYNYIKIYEVSANDSDKGRYFVNGRRGASDESVFVLNAGGGFDHAGLNNSFNNNNHCSHFAIVECDYAPTSVTFNPMSAMPADENGTTTSLTYASTYLPFAVSIPEDSGIYALIASKTDNNAALNLTKIATSDGVIPARTPVVLVKKNATEPETVTLVPSSTAGTPAEGNILVGHTGTAPEGNHHTLDLSRGGFALNSEKPSYTALLPATDDDTDDTVYTLNLPADLVPSSISEIESSATRTDVTIYDLQGRRLVEPVKGAINIINGNKILVK